MEDHLIHDPLTPPEDGLQDYAAQLFLLNAQRARSSNGMAGHNQSAGTPKQRAADVRNISSNMIAEV